MLMQGLLGGFHQDLYKICSQGPAQNHARTSYRFPLRSVQYLAQDLYKIMQRRPVGISPDLYKIMQGHLRGFHQDLEDKILSQGHVQDHARPHGGFRQELYKIMQDLWEVFSRSSTRS